VFSSARIYQAALASRRAIRSAIAMSLCVVAIDDIPISATSE